MEATNPLSETPPNVMLDLLADDPEREWCYLAKSTTVIGVPFQPDVTQVTYDGALFTKSAELCFFLGSELTPLLARQKTFLEGWMPLVQCGWRDGETRYSVEMFAFPLDGEDSSNTVNFVRLTASNCGVDSVKAVTMAAMRHSGQDGRMGSSPFNPAWRYEMEGGAAFRDGKLVYAFPGDAAPEAVPGEPYRMPFIGENLNVSERSEVCAARCERSLKPGEEMSVVLKMPRVPVDRSNAAFIGRLLDADYDAYRAKTISYWRDLTAKCPRFSIPEKRVNDSLPASLTHTLLATRSKNGRDIQTDGLPYPDFFLTASPQEGLIYLTMGLPELTRDLVVRNAITQQEPDGLYFDRALAHGGVIPTAHGHVMYISCITALYMRDSALAAEIFESVSRAVGYIEGAIDSDERGLLPPTYPYDNEMIDGHYASNNFWALLGLRQAVRLARFLGRGKEQEDWGRLERRYRENILKGVEASVNADGYLPPGLYPYLTGKQARRGFSEYQTNCDWENMLLAFPTELLEPLNPIVRATVERIRRGYAEGVMTYRHGQHLHQYITVNQIQQYLVMGDSYAALKDFYHTLLHAGSTHECFENLVIPWTDRQVNAHCPPPHAWASSILGLLIRNLLLMEYGGDAGLDAGRRELWLFHCLSPAWVRPGQRIGFTNAPTEFGALSAEMIFNVDGAFATFRAEFHTQPAAYRIRIPYFMTMTAFRTDAQSGRSEGGCLVLSPDATTLDIEWREKPGAHIGVFEDILSDYRGSDQFKGVDKSGAAVVAPGKAFIMDDEKTAEPIPLSFDMVLRTFLHEYARRADEIRKTGGELVSVEAPAMPVSPILS